MTKDQDQLVTVSYTVPIRRLFQIQNIARSNKIPETSMLEYLLDERHGKANRLPPDPFPEDEFPSPSDFLFCEDQIWVRFTRLCRWLNVGTGNGNHKRALTRTLYDFGRHRAATMQPHTWGKEVPRDPIMIDIDHAAYFALGQLTKRESPDHAQAAMLTLRKIASRLTAIRQANPGIEYLTFKEQQDIIRSAYLNTEFMKLTVEQLPRYDNPRDKIG